MKHRRRYVVIMNHAVLGDPFSADRMPEWLEANHSITVLFREDAKEYRILVVISSFIISRGWKITIGNTGYNYNRRLSDTF